LKRSGYIFLFLLLPISSLFAQQTRFSLSTDVNLLRNLRKQQRFWAVGQTVTGHFHFTPRDEAYAWLVYYSNGIFHNQLNATARQPTTTPQQIAFTNKARMRLRQISLGWKHYLKGAFNAENKWNLYASAGWGLMMGRIENFHSVEIDTAKYDVQVLEGSAHFKRLTADFMLGYEKPVGADVFLYLEARALVPITDYPSRFIYIYDNAPFAGSVNLGIRILF
jgi:hypothetical protein